MTKAPPTTDDGDEGGSRLPSFDGWSNEEIGAFLRGVTYIETGGDVEDVMHPDVGRSLLGETDPIAEDVDEESPFGSRAQHLDKMSDAADRMFRQFFGGKAMPVATQVSLDIQPFLDEIFDRLRAQTLTLGELDTLLRKMTVVTVASATMAYKRFGAK